MKLCWQQSKRLLPHSSVFSAFLWPMQCEQVPRTVVTNNSYFQCQTETRSFVLMPRIKINRSLLYRWSLISANPKEGQTQSRWITQRMKRMLVVEKQEVDLNSKSRALGLWGVVRQKREGLQLSRIPHPLSELARYFNLAPAIPNWAPPARNPSNRCSPTCIQI